MVPAALVTCRDVACRVSTATTVICTSTVKGFGKIFKLEAKTSSVPVTFSTFTDAVPFFVTSKVEVAVTVSLKDVSPVATGSRPPVKYCQWRCPLACRGLGYTLLRPISPKKHYFVFFRFFIFAHSLKTCSLKAGERTLKNTGGLGVFLNRN